MPLRYFHATAVQLTVLENCSGYRVAGWYSIAPAPFAL